MGERTVIDFILDEARDAGARRILIVVGAGDDAVARHHEPSADLAARLRRRGRDEIADWVEDPAGGLEIQFVTQPEPKGLGHALLCAADRLDGPFAIALGDAIVTPTVLRRLAAERERAGAAVTVAVQEVAREEVGKYGIVALGQGHDVAGIAEKPDPKTAPSRLAVAARYVATPVLLQALAATQPDEHGEVQLTDALRAVIASGERVVAVPLRGLEERVDVGTVKGYLDAIRRD
jgi:UTP--glucose-1-phosphate uridylyltransferase